MSIREFLKEHGLYEYVDVFEKNDISLPFIFDLNEDYLLEMGIKNEHRRKFLNFIQNKSSHILSVFDDAHNPSQDGVLLSQNPSIPLIMAHRGASGYELENSLAAFKKAIDLGSHAIQLEVYVCKSGELVVTNNLALNVNTNGEGKVTDYTLDELKKFNLGNGEKIPTLREVLDIVNDRIVVCIELKGNGTLVPLVEIIREYLSKGWKSNNFLVTSYVHQSIKYFRSYLPSVPTGIIEISEILGLAKIAKAAEADYFLMHQSLVTKELVNDAHSRGIKVIIFTINESEKIQDFVDMNIDGIITNYPDKLLSVLNNSSA